MHELLAQLLLPRFRRMADYLGPWAIEPMAGRALLEEVRRTDMRRHVAESTPDRKAASGPATTKINGQTIAIVMLTGTLQKAVSSMSDGTSTIQARADIRKAMNDPDIAGILVAIDSPGGTVAGTMELAADVRRAADLKPTWAFADDLCASAAYWVASATDRIYANNKTALVGSVGTLSVVYDFSQQAEDMGIKTLVFGTGPLKGAGAPGAPVTEDQQAYIRGIVEDAQKSFDAAVQKGRKLTDKQLSDVKSGGVFGAAEALDRKLIDGIKGFDQVVSELAAEARRQSRQSNARASGPVPQRSATVNDFDTFVTASGFDPANLTAGERVALTMAHSAGLKPALQPPTTTELEAQLAFSRKAHAEELTRQAKIAEVCGNNRALAAKAIGENWSVEKTELTALKESLPNGVRAAPNIITGVGRHRPGMAELIPGVSTSVCLEAALMMSMGRGDVAKLYKPEVLELAHANFRNIGLQQVIMIGAVENGYAGSPGERINAGNLREVLRYAFPVGGIDRRAEGASTVGLSGILGNIANKELLAGYMEEDQVWREIAAIRSVNDFKQVTSYRMLDNMEYEQVGPDGKIKHGTVDQESYTRQANTFAKMFALTRTHMINDDLGAFQDLRTRIGRGSAKKFNKVFWIAFINNSTFFTSARTNYISGSTTNLGIDGVGVGLAVQQFRKMTTPTADSTKHINADTQNPVGASPGGRPELMLVPPELEGNSEVTYRNQNLGQVVNSGANIYQNKYRPVVAWQLSDSAYTGYSSTAWYLFNNPGFLAPMVVSFLHGNQSPTVESAEADFDTLGVQFRGYHDFGADQAEYLSGLKSKGAA